MLMAPSVVSATGDAMLILFAAVTELIATICHDGAVAMASEPTVCDAETV